MCTAAAAVALVVYSDFQCQYCRQFTRGTQPQIEDRFARSDKLLRKIMTINPIFITTSPESSWIPELLQCLPQRYLAGPNRSDYLLVKVLDRSGAYPEQLVLATRHEGFSLDALPTSGRIAVYINELRRVLTPDDSHFQSDDVAKWDLGFASAVSDLHSFPPSATD